MPRIVSAADANRQFSEILGQAAGGETVIITRRGDPVAQLLPIGQRPAEETREIAMSRLLSTLEQGLRLDGGRFDRGELYDR